MNRRITTLLVFFFLATFSSSANLYEKQLLNIGKMYENQGNYKSAYSTYKRVLEENPDNEDAERGVRRTERKALKKETPPQKSSSRGDNSRVYAVQFLTTSSTYRRQAERKLKRLQSYGLNCYLKEGRYLYLRCNPSSSVKGLQKALQIAKRRGLDHFIVKDTIPSTDELEKRAKESEPVEEKRAERGRTRPATRPEPAPEKVLDEPKRETPERGSRSRVPNSAGERPKSLPIASNSRRERPQRPPTSEDKSTETKKAPENLPLPPSREKAKPPVKKPERELSPKEKMLLEMKKKREVRDSQPPVKKPERELSPKEKMLLEMKKKREARDGQPPVKKPERELSPKEKMLLEMKKKREARDGQPPAEKPERELSPKEKMLQKRGGKKPAVGNKPPKGSLLKRPTRPEDVKASKFTLKEGYDALNGKNMTKAKEVFSDIIKYNPNDEGAVFGLALVFMNEGDWTKAYIILKPIAKKTKRKDIKETFIGIKYNMYLKKGWKNVASKPADSVKFFQEAQKIKDSSDISEGLSYAFNNNNESDKAIPHVMTVYKKKKDFKSAKMMIDTYLKAKKPKKAEEFFDSLDPSYQVNMKYNPKKTRALEKVKSLIEQRKVREAKGILRELYLLYPTDLNVLYHLGQVYEHEEKYKEAIEYYKTVLSSEEGHKDALFNLSQIYMKQGKNQEAHDVLQELQKNKVKVEKYIDEVRLRMFLADGKDKEAIALAKELLLDNPTEPRLYIILGDLHHKLKKNREAYFYYAKAYQLDSDNFDTRMSLLNLLLEQKLFDQIQTILEQFKNYDLTPAQKNELKNFYKKYYKTYTATSLQDKDYKYALMGAKAGLQMMPNDLGLMESGGWAALNGGQYPDAVYFFSKIIAQKPDAYSQMYGLGLAYVNMKEMEKAKVAFKDAEKTPDRDLLYKIAGIYKDIGLKKDAYRVIKMLEKSSQKPKPSAAPAPASNEPTEEELSVAPPPKDPVPEAGDSQRDNLNTFNPFLSEVEKPPPPPPPVQKPKPEPKPNIEPMQQAEPVKKKSGRWF